MKTLITLLFLALGLQAQTPKASIVIRVTDDAGTLYVAKITGTPASAGLDTLKQWMATQTICDTANPPVCTPKFTDAADAAKEMIVGKMESLAPQFPSAQSKADVEEIDTKIAALQAKRKQLFDAARAEK